MYKTFSTAWLGFVAGSALILVMSEKRKQQLERQHKFDLEKKQAASFQQGWNTALSSRGAVIRRYHELFDTAETN